MVYLAHVAPPVLTPDLVTHLTANELGERLMALTHIDVPEEPYRSWRPYDLEVRADARPWGDAETRAFYGVYLEGEEGPLKRALAFSFSEQGFDIDYCCYWDGDAMAAFSVSQGGQTLRMLENWDAKKSDRWREDSEGAEQSLTTSFAALRDAPYEDTFIVTFVGDSESEKRFRTLPALEEHVAAIWASESALSIDAARVERIHYADLSRELYSEIRNPNLLPEQATPSGPRLRPSALT
jgi:hypothetical protein